MLKFSIISTPTFDLKDTNTEINLKVDPKVKKQGPRWWWCRRTLNSLPPEIYIYIESNYS